MKRTCCPAGELPPDDAFAVFLHVCQRTGLDPLLREASLLKRRAWNRDRNAWDESWQTLVQRDGYLSAAHRTGALRGIQTTVHPEDCSRAPTHATCRVWRAGWAEPVVATVAFSEYCETTKEGKPRALWASKPRTMIAKVAEAHALRRAFSLHGTYCAEELPSDPPPAIEAPREVVVVRDPTPPPVEAAPPVKYSPSKAAKAAFARLADLGYDKAGAKAICQQTIPGKESSKEYTEDDWRAVHLAIDELEADMTSDAQEVDDAAK